MVSFNPESLACKMARLNQSLISVRDELETYGNVTHKALTSLEVDSECLAKYCSFIRKQQRQLNYRESQR